MSQRNYAQRAALLCGVSVLTLGAMAAPSLAMAQDAPVATADEDTDVDEVVITGIRASLKTAQDIKESSEVIVDSVTAVDIGALPDRSVSEALQRISGVTLQRTNAARDPARLAAEGGGVFVRGLSWVRSETNGRDIFSASSGRGLSYEDVSADLLAGVDVYKNVAANMIEGGIAGTVNLRTRAPFDAEDSLVAINTDYNYGDLSERGFWSGSILASDRWDTPIGEIGALVNLSIGNVGNRTDSISVDRYDPVVLNAGNASDGRVAGDTVYVPKYMGWRTIDWEQNRTALAFALQWAPNDQWLVTLQGLGAQADAYNVEYALGTESVLSPNSTYDYNDDDVFIGGTVFDANYNTDTRIGDDTKKTGDISLNVRFSPNDKWSFSGDLQYVKSTAEIYSMTAFTQLEDRPDLDIRIRGDLPKITSTGGSMQDQSQYWWAAAMDHIEDNEADELAGRLDARYDFDEGFLKSVAFGVRATDKDYINRQTGYNWSLLSHQYWGGGPAVYLDETGYAGGTQDPRLPNSSTLYKFDNFFRGNTQVPGVAWFPSEGLLNRGTAYAYDILRNTESAGWGWTPLSDDYESYQLGSGNGGITELTEETQAAYVYARFGGDNLFGKRFDGNVGLRVVRTEIETESVVTIPTIQGSCPPIVNPAADCTGFNRAVAFTQGGPLTGQTISKEYTNVLPSLNVRAFLRDDLQLRFAVSRAMVRPEMYQLQPFTNLAINFEADGATLDDLAPFTGTAGNPGLEPVKATNYDVSLEWYFAPGGSLTFAVFHKDITDYIFTGSNTVSYTNGGQTFDFVLTQYQNGDEGTVDGFEIAYQQFYDFLPGPLSGLGLQGNFTLIESDGGRNASQNVLDPQQNAGAAANLPLEGMSRTSYNLAVLYEKYGISARLAYNWREEYLLTTSAANVNAPVWASDYGQLDGSVFYSITPKIKFGVQATNLLNERTVLKVGNETRKPPYNWVDTDRRVAVVLRASF